ncbi:DoxX subfamily, partial [bacterium]|nr:DoxX subfamily [bacterium]
MTEPRFEKNGSPSSWRISALRVFVTVLRLAIGWHFLYEGLFKIALGNWTAFGYLSNTSGFLSGFYHWLANTPSLLRITDMLNMAGLVLIGLALC